MGYTSRLVDSISQIDVAAWDDVWKASGSNVFMDRGFIAAVETGMRDLCRFRHVIVYDEEGRAVACACLSTFVIELANMTEPGVAAVIRRLPRFFSGLTRLKILFCGLPVSAGQTSLAFVPGCDRGAVVATVDELLGRIAREDGASLISFKEFDPGDHHSMDVLGRRGYTRFDTPPMHQFEAVFGSLDDYCAALKAHYRDQIVLSRKKFEQGGATMTVVADPVELERIHTPAVHQLYLNVVNRAEMKVEVLTDAFFRALAREMPRQVRMIVFTCRDEILAYTWNLQTDTALYILFAGVSYERNADFDLYFNLLYATLDYGMRQGVSTIQVGQTADVFKARVGCTSEPRYALAKGVRPLMAWTFRNLLVRLIPRPVPGPKFNIYRAGTAAARPGAAGAPRVG